MVKDHFQAAPFFWNNHPVHIHQASSLHCFKSLLKLICLKLLFCNLLTSNLSLIVYFIILFMRLEALTLGTLQISLLLILLIEFVCQFFANDVTFQAAQSPRPKRGRSLDFVHKKLARHLNVFVAFRVMQEGVY